MIKNMIAFRVDANEHIATGHLMRCLAIAAEIKKRGEQCIFFLAEQKGTELIETREFPYIVLQSKWNRLEEEIPIIIKKIEEYSLDWLVVDSYQATVEYLRQLNKKVPVLYLDDMAKEVYPVSMVLHYTDWLENDSYQKQYVNTNTRVLAGMKYVPLREEFYPKWENKLENTVNKKYNKKEKTGNILITTGGTDTYNIAGKFLNKVFETEAGIPEKIEADLPYRELQNIIYHVIIGAMNQNREELEQLKKRHSNIVLHFNVSNMGELMRSSDFAISAGGTTLFELCACQVPTVCFSFADNQEAFAKKMGDRHAMLYAGDPRYQNIDIAENLCNSLTMLINNYEYAEELTNNMGLLVDGKGVQRIVKELMENKKENC